MAVTSNEQVVSLNDSVKGSIHVGFGNVQNQSSKNAVMARQVTGNEDEALTSDRALKPKYSHRKQNQQMLNKVAEKNFVITTS